MKSKLWVFLFGLSLALPSTAQINPDIHKMCIDAKDYKGCINANKTSATNNQELDTSECDRYLATTGPSYLNCIKKIEGKSGNQIYKSGTVNVQEPSTYNYDAGSVSALEIRGSYGRYITFIGKTVNQYDGTPGYYNPGSPGRQVCSTYGSTYGTYGYGATTSCNTVGYVAPSYSPGTSAGVHHRNYRYELDCRDMTFDRKGDLARGMAMKGWMHVRNDPTAQDVANRYCPIIDSLPRVKRK